VRIRGEGWAVLAACCFIGLELSVRTAAPYAPPNLGSFVRIWPLFVGSWAGALATSGARGSLRRLLRKEHAALLGALAVDGVLNLFVANALKLDALRQGGIVLTLTAVEVGQLFGTALLVRLWLRHRVSRTVLSGLFVIVAGTAVASWSQVFVPGWGSVLALSLAAGLCFAVAVTCVGWVLRHGVGLWPALAVSSTVGLIVTWFASVVSGTPPTGSALAHVGDVGIGFLLLSGVAYAAALFFLTGALQRISIVSANAISAANGPAAALVGALLFGPRVTMALVVGVVLVAIGAVVVRTRHAMDEQEDALPRRPGGSTHPASA